MNEEQQKIIANFEIKIEASKRGTIDMMKFILARSKPDEAEFLGNQFEKSYLDTIKKHENEDTTDLARYYRLVMEFKPALATIIKPGKEFDEICDAMIASFNATLNRIRGQINDNRKQNNVMKGAILPGSNKTIHLKYFCTVCKETFNIPPEIESKLLNSDEKIPLPKHCDKEMVVQIARNPRPSAPKKAEIEPTKPIEIYPAELLMQHTNSVDNKADYLELVSVGIDIGSSTSHLVFSRLTLRREISFFNMTNRFFLINREIIYEGNIIFTPLLDEKTIDIEAVVNFCHEEYKNAGLMTENVDTGAVIVTGETAKKQNAAEIASRLSSESGKFVSATAGPNFESLLGAMGSGIVKQSKETHKTIMNVDIGGGTSNLAIASNGDVTSCSCINVGGRLLGIDQGFKIWRINEPSDILMKEIGMNYQIGDIIPEADARTIAQEYAKALIEVMLGPATSPITKDLMMTEDLDFTIPVDLYSFSGGVAEMMYGTHTQPGINLYNDIGHYLAEEILKLTKEKGMRIIEPENKIRATVIGAGSFSLSVSGSTCFVSKEVELPMNNIPVIPIQLKKHEITPAHVQAKIRRAYANYDMEEGKDLAALYFKDILLLREEVLGNLAKAVESALPYSVEHKKPIILLFENDLAKLLGIRIRDETKIQTNLICLDELKLEAGDWIDIGAPFQEKEAYPITIKSLVFNQNKTVVEK